MSGFESLLLSYLLNSLWQVPLLFGAGWLTALALRSAGGRVEHRLWVSAGLLQALVPACSLLPWSHIRLLTSWLHPSTRQSHVTVTMGAGIALTSRFPAQLYTVIATAYGAAILYFFARFLWRGWSLLDMRCETVEFILTGEAARCWQRCSERFSVRNASIAVSLRAFGPVTLGIRHKIVLLPASMAADSADLPAVIAHEFAHMHRNDFAKNLCYELLLLPVSYHPLCLLTRERISESREMVCDQVAAEINGRREYAHSLLRLASLLVQQRPAIAPHAIGLFDANTLERRLMKLSKRAGTMQAMTPVAIVGICALAGVGTCGSALALGIHLGVPAGLTETEAPQTAAPSRITVSSGVMAGNLLTKVEPKYPEAAKKAGIQGTIVLSAVIGREGTVEELQVVSGPEDLRASALDAVRQWTYKPYLLNGEPVEVKTTVNITYSLQN